MSAVEQINPETSVIKPQRVIDYYKTVHTSLWIYPILFIKIQQEQQHFNTKGFFQQQTILQVNIVILEEELVNFLFEMNSSKDKVKRDTFAQNNHNGINTIAIPNMQNSLMQIFNDEWTQSINTSRSESKNYNNIIQNISIESNLTTKIVVLNNLDPNLNFQIIFIELTQTINIVVAYNTTDLDQTLIMQLPSIEMNNNISSPTNNLDQYDQETINPNRNLNMQRFIDKSEQSINDSSSETENYTDDTNNVSIESNLATKIIIVPNNLDQNGEETIVPKRNLIVQRFLDEFAESLNNSNCDSENYEDDTDQIWIETKSPTDIVVPNNLDQSDQEDIDPNTTLNMHLDMFDESIQSLHTSSGGSQNYEDDIKHIWIETKSATDIVVSNNLDQNDEETVDLGSLNMHLDMFDESIQSLHTSSSGSENYEDDIDHIWIETKSANDIVVPNNLDQYNEENIVPKRNLNVQRFLDEFAESLLNTSSCDSENYEDDTDQIWIETTSNNLDQNVQENIDPSTTLMYDESKQSICNSIDDLVNCQDGTDNIWIASNSFTDLVVSSKLHQNDEEDIDPNTFSNMILIMFDESIQSICNSNNDLVNCQDDTDNIWFASNSSTDLVVSPKLDQNDEEVIDPSTSSDMLHSMFDECIQNIYNSNDDLLHYEDDNIWIASNSATDLVVSNKLDQNDEEDIDPNTSSNMILFMFDESMQSIYTSNGDLINCEDYTDNFWIPSNSDTEKVVSNKLDQNDQENIDPNTSLNMLLSMFDECIQSIYTSNGDLINCEDYTDNFWIPLNSSTEKVVSNNLNQNLNIQNLVDEPTQNINSYIRNYKEDTYYY